MFLVLGYFCICHEICWHLWGRQDIAEMLEDWNCIIQPQITTIPYLKPYTNIVATHSISNVVNFPTNTEHIHSSLKLAAHVADPCQQYRVPAHAVTQVRNRKTLNRDSYSIIIQQICNK